MPSCGCRPAAPLRYAPASNSATAPRPAVSLPLRCPSQQHLPDSSLPQCRHPLRHGTPGHQLCLGAQACHQLSHGAPAIRSAPAPPPASSRWLFAAAPLPATNLIRQRRTPVWLAIWRTWAGFANSQHRDAAFATPDNICAHLLLRQTQIFRPICFDCLRHLRISAG